MIDRRCIYTTSLMYHTKFNLAAITSSLELSYLQQYLGQRLDGNTMVPFPPFLALEIKSMPEILHQIKNDYAECYLLSLREHTEA